MHKLGVKGAEARRLAPQIADAFLAHYAGDERFQGAQMLSTEGLSLMGGIVVRARKELVVSLWHDLPPADRDLSILLEDGRAMEEHLR